MRRRTLIALLAAAAMPAAPRAQQVDSPADDPTPGGYPVSVDLNVQGAIGFETFETALQPYGDWIAVGSYGSVWRPRVVAGWRPYYYGRWEWTNEGWFWVSDEPWGWAVFHYGRWAYDPYYGWIWIPGYEWAPAWVSWRASGDVIGWAPLAPGYSVYVTAYPFIDFWWTFVPSVRFVSVPVYSVAYAPVNARRWFYATAPAPARPAPRRGPALAPAWGGPAPRLIEQRIGRPIAPARIVRAPSPAERGRPGEVPVYRPERHEGGPPAFARPQREERPGPARVEAPGRGPGPVPAPRQGPARVEAPGRGSGPARVEAPDRGSGPARVEAPGRGSGPAPAPGYAGGGGGGDQPVRSGSGARGGRPSGEGGRGGRGQRPERGGER